MTPPRLSPWAARVLRRAGRADVAYAVSVLVLAVVSLWSGRAAARHLSPEAAASASKLLDQLELPAALPNSVVTRDDGLTTRLHDLLQDQPRTILTFYAPWCGPCQEELPTLVSGTAAHPQRLLVVVGSDEDPAEVRRKLDNLGQKQLHYFVDTNGQVQAGGGVTALPTSFLLSPGGRVRERIVGYSQFRLRMMVAKAMGEVSTPSFEP